MDSTGFLSHSVEKMLCFFLDLVECGTLKRGVSGITILPSYIAVGIFRAHYCAHLIVVFLKNLIMVHYLNEPEVKLAPKVISATYQGHVLSDRSALSFFGYLRVILNQMRGVNCLSFHLAHSAFQLLASIYFFIAPYTLFLSSVAILKGSISANTQPLL